MPIPWLNLGFVNVETGRPEDAEDCLARAIALEPAGDGFPSRRPLPPRARAPGPGRVRQLIRAVPGRCRRARTASRSHRIGRAVLLDRKRYDEALEWARQRRCDPRQSGDRSRRRAGARQARSPRRSNRRARCIARAAGRPGHGDRGPRGHAVARESRRGGAGRIPASPVAAGRIGDAPVEHRGGPASHGTFRRGGSNRAARLAPGSREARRSLQPGRGAASRCCAPARPWTSSSA